jgi:hypothetical protein
MASLTKEATVGCYDHNGISAVRSVQSLETRVSLGYQPDSTMLQGLARLMRALARGCSHQDMSDERSGFRTLKSDASRVRETLAKIRHVGAGRSDPRRILCVLAAGGQADRLLLGSVPALLRQVSDAKLSADLLIGLNNGFDCPTLWKVLRNLPSTTVDDLYFAPKLDARTPSEAFTSPNLDGVPFSFADIGQFEGRHRIFAMHQREGVNERGKIRILSDVYGLLIRSLMAGWCYPTLMCTLDADSRFLLAEQNRSPSLESNGLRKAIEELLERKLDLLGCRLANAAYVTKKDVDVPDFDLPIPALYLVINALHGLVPGMTWLPGAGTFGNADVLMSLLATVCIRYPNEIIEDVHASVLASDLGFRMMVSDEVFCTNQCYPQDQFSIDVHKPMYLAPLRRWAQGLRLLECLYSRGAVEGIACSDLAKVLTNPDNIRLLMIAQARGRMDLWEVLKWRRLAAADWADAYDAAEMNRPAPD